ncbi:MAG: oligosaccharide flippase family protein, partial [Lachnospiraceae bacterium]|nr:oligosaccharide flippase family protein [Lachnospiraceae bacterium]
MAFQRFKPGRSAQAMDMTSGPIAMQILMFSLPLLAGNVFQQFYNTVDSVVVGNFVGPEALGAVTANMPATMTLISLFIGFSSGASVVISQYFGAKNEEKLRKTVHTSVVATVFLSFAMTALGILITPALVYFMKTPPEIAEMAMIYLRIYFAGLIWQMLYNMGSAILRAVGDSRRPLYFLIFCSLCNVALDLLFVIR